MLQTNNIHIAVCKPGDITRTLAALKARPATARAKARFVSATDGDLFEAEDLATGEAPISCTFADLPNHFGFFLALTVITTVRLVPRKLVRHPCDQPLEPALCRTAEGQSRMGRGAGPVPVPRSQLIVHMAVWTPISCTSARPA